MTRRASWLFFVAAVLFLVAGLIPVLKSRPVNVVFLSSALLWLVMGLVASRNAGRGGPGNGDPS
jgi:hypothetical protein